MKFSLLTSALISAIALSIALPNTAKAEVAIDVIGGSEITFEGLVQTDGNWFSNDIVDLNGNGANGRNSEFELRRAELILKGKGPGNFEWVLGYDAKADKFLDTNIKYKIGGSSNQFIQLGQYKQPNSLEELTSTKNNDFISKAAVTNAYSVSRRLGGSYSISDSQWSVTASAFGRELTRNLAHGNGYGVRGTFAPINEKGNVLHLGLSYVNYNAYEDTYRLRVRPNADLATVRLVDSGDIKNADRISTMGLEALWIMDSFKVQGEYFNNTVKRKQSRNYKTDGWYLSGLWNITGESWGYKSGVHSTGLPNEPAKGMWQLGLRYDSIDLNNGNIEQPLEVGGVPVVSGILGGKMDTWTVGANWYWRSNFKMALNYVNVSSSKYSKTASKTVDDNPHVLEARLQFFW